MNMPNENDNPTDSTEIEFLELIVRYQDNALTPQEVETLSEFIQHHPAKREVFRQMQMRTAAIHDLLRMEAFAGQEDLLDSDSDIERSLNSEGDEFRNHTSRSGLRSEKHKTSASWRRRPYLIAGILGVPLLVVLGAMFLLRLEPIPLATHEIEPVKNGPAVLLVEEIKSKFFGTASLIAGETVALQRDYMLQSGIVKLSFPSGASAIIDAPSIFRVETESILVMNSGTCSVHAPPGAEGFEVLTPMAKVIDRGTRFYVNVEANSDTEVHVIEGAADLYSIPDSSAKTVDANAVKSEKQNDDESFIHLTNGEALRIGSFVETLVEPTPFDSKNYRGQLPDRLVEYQASSTPQGTADELISVKVQRHGQILSYTVDELIPIQVTRFRADLLPDLNGFLCGFQKKPNSPGDWLEDRNLSTGIINFGGQFNALSDLSGLNSKSDDPPGLGVRFRQPVVNHAGPDILLFEIQCLANTMEGDPFHVYPVTDRTDLKPVTIKKYDVTMDSPITREVAPLWSHRFPNTISSLAELEIADAPVKVEVSRMHFRVVGVGIDLSDMGFEEGAQVEELFFQNASDENTSKIDPVFIAGLPPLKPENK
jgi:hypothetical protein